MKKLTWGILCLLIGTATSLQAQDQNANAPIVNTQYGHVRGITEGGISVFKGIPYAAAPVGEFRWRPPQPVKAWEGELDATKFGSNCAQSGFRATAGTIAEGSSEDCLYLNLWTPANSTPKSKLPVMVWIHGGGFTGGSGSSPQNFGHEFTKNGVILVNINYRLGRLGYFAHPALSKEFPNDYKGNYGYMDQIAALQWIQKNIAAFGGDPKNVTIFGFSAGGVSVHSLLTIPSAKGLFHKIISESGGGRDGVLTGRPINKENADIFYKVSAETIGMNFAKKHGIEGTDAAALAKLRALKVEQIVDSGQETDGPNGPRTYSGPILDGKLVVETAESAYNAGRQPKMPLMIGNCSAEIGGPFVSNAKTKEELFASFGELAEEVKAAYDAYGSKTFNEVITKFNTDWVWGEPARLTARAFLAKQAPTYMYQFGYVPPNALQRSPYGAGHGSEVSFAFNTLNARWGAPAEPTAQEKELAKNMNIYWTNFAKTGNPNGVGVPNWPLYNNATQDMIDVELDGKINSKADPRKARFDVIEKGFKNRGKIQSRGI
ncbi:carboxylesterase family protein [Aquirufa ecclesiirivi]|uniref:carboxylesterase/lipase family protein n=1 Tax=Aquirufa ecclesiirivi TaxID=2715124 RepID=UPI0022A86E02|nr:carboxylesterase family protein [Aquirufa ecclesiirivi]MCZ2473177.1 carboxylesterase family protein [Aquirufa ecclesiirivi]